MPIPLTDGGRCSSRVGRRAAEERRSETGGLPGARATFIQKDGRNTAAGAAGAAAAVDHN